MSVRDSERGLRPGGPTQEARSLPSGTRDVLPAEMAELRAIMDALREVFEWADFGEIATPTLEYAEVLERGGGGAAEPAYRLFDQQGHVLALRSDMTLPIARVVATRYADASMPLRFWYAAAAYRDVRPRRGQRRELLQAGIELIGVPAPEGTAETLIVLCTALEKVGLEHFRVGLGDAALYPALLAAHGVPEAAHRPLLHELATRDFVGLEREIGKLGLSAEESELLLMVPQLRGGAELLDAAGGAIAVAVEGLRAVHAELPPTVAERVIFDLGLVRELGYYSGAIFDVYDPALGTPLGGGGRYDELLGRFGRSLPAVGFALNVEQLHIALTGEERTG